MDPRTLPRDAIDRLMTTPAAIAALPSRPPPAARMCEDLDDATTRYIIAMRPAFDDLRHATGQIASLLILQAAKGSATLPDYPMLAQTASACRQARDRVFSMRPPPAAAHHHAHLSCATVLITKAAERSLAAIHRPDDETTDAILSPLRAGWREMHSASRALPGFETVSFAATCCAAHSAGNR